MSPPAAHHLSGPSTAPWLTLLHPVGADRHTWAPVLAPLAERYRVLSLDLRGHGDAPARGARCGVDDLADDVLALWQQLGIERCHVLGVSLGGCVGLALAHRRPAAVHRLVIANARLEMDEAATAMWRQRAATALAEGMAPLVEPTLQRWLTPEFQAAWPERSEAVRQTLAQTSPEGFAACAEALADMHQRARLSDLALPTLLLTGRADTAVPSALVRADAATNPALAYAEIDGPHLLHQENPEDFVRVVLDFLAAKGQG